MINLDELKRELYEKAWYIDGGMENRELCINFDTALSIIAKHVCPKPTPDRAAMVDAVVVFLRRELSSPCRNHDYCDPEGDSIVALFEAAGWGPGPTERQMLAMRRVLRFGMDEVHTLQMSECLIVHDYLERHRRLVLGVQGE